jgi:uncharacterized protein YyaL (SSP411 family)
MSDAPTDRNRLDEEASPYLRQHADNPVNWQPWDETALEVARERDVPIFLSIGYSACHWCHVMEEESFQDPAMARVLNDRFVPVKVDREERPDLDSVYQTICQLVTGSGGWPLSVWLTPDGEPFYVGTYFPPEPGRGRPGFRSLCEDIAASWADPEDREEIQNRAAQWTDAIEGELEEVPEPGEPPGPTLLSEAAAAAVRSADREHGGFGTGQKFPQTGRLHLLARAAAGGEGGKHRAVLREGLDAMADGGLYDHVGGGFHRYCTDREWVVPHFEKMLYDQAEITRAMLAGSQLLGEQRYADRARGTLAFVERELRHPEGGFFSTLDAQSEGEEGAFYVWTPEEVREAVDEGRTAELFCEHYGVTERGNFEGGRTVLTVDETVPALAESHDLSTEAVRERLDRAREAVFEARAGRPRPARDEKVLAGWNGLMISAFAEAALVLDPALAATAETALGFVRERLWDADSGRLTRRWKDGDARVSGYLEDYAFLGRGALDTYEATGDVEHLSFALELARAIEREFHDPEAGTLYFTPEGGEELVARPQEPYDQSTPSSMGVAASLLLALDGFLPEGGFGEIAEGVLATQSNRLSANPLRHASLVLAADEAASGHTELTVAADALPLPERWREDLAGAYLPRRLLAPRPPTEAGLQEWLDRLGLDAAPPLWAQREAREGDTVYLCESFTCSPPQDSLAGALDWRASS